jgi:hypothetical protein
MAAREPAWTPAFARLASGVAGTDPREAPDDAGAKTAADALALAAHGWMAEAALNNSLDSAWRTLREKPVDFEAALGKAKTNYLTALGVAANGEGPEAEARLQARLGEEFDRRAAAYRAGVADATLERRAREAGDAANALTASYAGIADMARLAAGRPDGEQAVSGAVGRAKAQIDAMVAAGALPATVAPGAKHSVDNAAIAGAAHAEFDRIGDPDAQLKFAHGILDAWGGGKGAIGKLDETTARGLAAELEAEATANSERVIALRQASDNLVRSGNATLASQGLELLATGALTAQWLDAHQADLPPIAAAAFGALLRPDAPLRPDPEFMAALARKADAGDAIGAGLAGAIAAGNVPIADAQRLASLPTAARDRDARWRFDAAAKPGPGATGEEFAAHWADMRSLDDWLRANPDADERTVTAKVTQFTADAGNRRAALRRGQLPPPPFAAADSFSPGQYASVAASTVAAAVATTERAAGDLARQLVAWRDHFRAVDPSFIPKFQLPPIAAAGETIPRPGQALKLVRRFGATDARNKRPVDPPKKPDELAAEYNLDQRELEDFVAPERPQP